MSDRIPVPVRLDTPLGNVQAGVFSYLATPAPRPWAPGPRPNPIGDYDVVTGSYNGWTFGWGTVWQIESADGWADMMSLKTQDASIPGDGEVFGADWEEKRVFTVEFSGAAAMLEQCWPRQPGTLVPQRINEARCACLRRQDDLPLVINDRWLVMARPRRFLAPQRRGEPPKLTVSWEMQDPALYSVSEFTAASGLESRGLGRPYPRPSGSPGTIPGSWRYRGAGTGGVMPVFNMGCRRTFLRVRITGPVQNPILVNQRSFERIEFNLTLAAGERLDIDMRRGTILLNGTASRYYRLSADSTWWSCGPGTTLVRYLSRGPVTTSLATIWYRSAW